MSDIVASYWYFYYIFLYGKEKNNQMFIIYW